VDGVDREEIKPRRRGRGKEAIEERRRTASRIENISKWTLPSNGHPSKPILLPQA
jgi:hypothetical protein